MKSSIQHRRGSSYLEVQVAMVLLAIGTAGLYSMSVVQTKQTRRLLDVLPAAEVPALNRSTDPWMRKLGVYASVDQVVAPTGIIPAYSYVEQVVDDSDGSPGFTYFKDPGDIYGWVDWGHSRARLGNAHYHRSYGNVGSYAEFVVTGLPVGEYEVLTHYPEFASLGSSIAHEIEDGTTWRATVNVDQKVATSEVTFGGRDWDRLGVVQINSGTLRVRLLDGPGATNYIIADSILVRSARSFELLSVSETVGGGATATLEAP